MNLLLDTHIALWALTDDARLSIDARVLIMDGGNRVFTSVVSQWEVAIKKALRPEKIPVTGREFLHYCSEAGYMMLPLRERHVLALEDLPAIHADPFDRILVAQAESESMVLLTHDKVVAGYGECIRMV